MAEIASSRLAGLALGIFILLQTPVMQFPVKDGQTGRTYLHTTSPLEVGLRRRVGSAAT